MPLTKLEIDRIEPGEKQIKVTDGQGLYLLVMPNGSKYWRLKYRFSGKEKVLALGVYPEVSLKDARLKRDDARRLLAQDEDPGELKKKNARKQQYEASSTLQAVAQEWWSKMSAEWAPNHANGVWRSLEIHLLPELGHRPIRDISAMDLLLVLQSVEQRGLHDTANRLRERCNAIWRRAVKTGRAEHNPAADLAGELITPVSKPQPSLAREELPAFLAALAGNEHITLQTKYLIKLVMICFTRIGETVQATWHDFDLDQALWTIPPETRKLKRALKAAAAPHIVPLPSQAVDILKQLSMHRMEGNDFVFPSFFYRGRHMSKTTLLKAFERMGYSGKNTENGHVVTHGFRATASTILNEAGFNPDAIERQLSHKEPNQVRAAYNRAQYMEERRAMLQSWADYLDKVEQGGDTTLLAAMHA
ncbi:integrase arm-type DNA-binding domain-containing protein [Chromobacterium sp. IIBBL 290-4]|uniref:tyrosine-type recombinase/integrase n=1 Tax=Chromobacterium sp. IIBBL 290-4 TaxID=2953890 RepID=UPI0020B8A759|nr:integrase arm-type DNA-binding domain-containing protein [Chromobacterium sp. IIBBL 290-4]UTH73361.1 tyrosine-type recombinase/integrase [Chromobacterium sp. IIBBL 290-4]